MWGVPELSSAQKAARPLSHGAEAQWVGWALEQTPECSVLPLGFVRGEGSEWALSAD